MTDNNEGWISVKNQRPEMGQDVFVCLNDQTILMGRWVPKHQGSSVSTWVAYFKDGLVEVILRKVTHWMPLPSPPRTKE